MAEVKSGRITAKDAEEFGRQGFSGLKYLPSSDARTGFNAVSVRVNGEHPDTTMPEDTTRVYYVIGGEGYFNIDGQLFAVAGGDLYVIAPGSSYKYWGQMELFEFNVFHEVAVGKSDSLRENIESPGNDTYDGMRDIPV